MDSQSDTKRSNPRFMIGVFIFAAIAVAVILFAVVDRSSSANNLLPILASPTPVPGGSETVAPISVTFSELNSDPVAYLNLSIQVAGEYLPLDAPACPRYSGPAFHWAVISEELQLDAKGFDRVVRILEPGTEMMIQGIWRLYQGPLGCGKGPTPGSAWYLQVQHIVQPNPLVGNGSAADIIIENVNPSFPSLLPTETPTITPSATPEIATTTATIVVETPTTIEPTVSIDATLASTPILTPATETATPDSGVATPGPSPTPDLTLTSSAGNGGDNPTATPGTPLPPTATETSGGYPGGATATPSETAEPYP